MLRVNYVHVGLLNLFLAAVRSERNQEERIPFFGVLGEELRFEL